MKIQRLTIRGFRGFNEQREIDFHNQLTLIHAPNSYGKTSISEAVEWLFYGATSKIEHADFKDEYKGSCRNCHLPDDVIPFVEGIFLEAGEEATLKAVLGENDEPTLYFNDKEVSTWLLDDLFTVPRPFILQHTLKYLLLTRPSDRYKQIADLIGLTELEQIQNDFISLCTKPQTPTEVKRLQRDIDSLQSRVKNCDPFDKIANAFEKGKKGLSKLKTAILDECERVIDVDDASEDEVLLHLLRIREERIGNVFQGKVSFPEYTDVERQFFVNEENHFLETVGESAVMEYARFGASTAAKQILNFVKFYELGTQFLKSQPDTCPFCDQPIDQKIIEHINQNHQEYLERGQAYTEQNIKRSEFKERITNLKSQITKHRMSHFQKLKLFLAIEDELSQLESVLVPKHQVHFEVVRDAFFDLSGCNDELEERYQKVIEAIDNLVLSLETSQEDTDLMVILGEALTSYISASNTLVATVLTHARSVYDANQILLHELDILAGTEDVSLLIQLLERFDDIEKKFEIDSILGDGLKTLRKTVDQYSARKMLEMVAGEMTKGVMEWYNRIRTVGDPDVHFDGFDLERTKGGALKSRQVRVKAKSYGSELVSAVSSLSESKLNVLGISISIASNLNNKTPFEFLIVDDPTQSLDEDHETQFIDVIRDLVQMGKQIILLSHDNDWLKQVRSNCRDINGLYYEITGYDESGPTLLEMTWEPWKARLDEVDSILKDKSASSVRLQHAEEEIRIAVTQITAELYKQKTDNTKRPSQLNAKKVRNALIECGVDMALVNRICQTFGTTDDAHHAPENYSAHKGRIQTYYGYVHELARLLK